jgi:hypothetical protein
LGELIDLVAKIGIGDQFSRSKDILGRVYEYFLGQFASAEGKKGGQFYTPRCIVGLLVEMLLPYKGRVFDPCCGSGGMFVQSEKFVTARGGRIGDISIFGQEKIPRLGASPLVKDLWATWQIAHPGQFGVNKKMRCAVPVHIVWSISACGFLQLPR